MRWDECTHELTTAVTTYPRPTPDQRGWGRLSQSPTPVKELLGIDGEGETVFFRDVVSEKLFTFQQVVPYPHTYRQL